MYHYNHLGSTTAVTDQAGKLVYSYDYGTYGELTTTTEYSTIAPKVRFLYNGQLGVMTDDNTLYYMRQRYYNPQIKRFINQDILTGSIGNSASLNRYSYVEGNPISYTDPFGLSPFSYMSEPLHNTLDWFGMIPVVGAGFDLINATIYLMEGKPTYALFAAISSVGPADGVKFIIKNGKKSIIGMTLTGLFCQTDAGAGLKQDLTGLGQDYITYYGYDQMSNTELALSLTMDIVFGAKSGYDDLNIKKKNVDVDVDDFVPDNATSKVNKIDGDDLVPDNTSAVINRTDVDNVVANTQGFGGCFVEGTEIKTIDGDKNIEDIHAGDMVYSKNTETGEEGYKEVVRVFKKKTYELVYLTVGDEEIITTPNHPFYVVDEGFVEAGNLQIGDEVETADGEILEIEAITIEYLDKPIQIYNFEVADWHTYYVSEEEVLVHNNCFKGGRYSDEALINATKEIHYAQYKDAWWGKKNPITVTQATDGTIVISKNNGVIGRKSRQKAREIFGDDVIIVKGRGANYNNAMNLVQTASPNHAEARGVQALISRNIEVSGARQATTLPSCVDCMKLQKDLDIINLTGVVRGKK